MTANDYSLIANNIRNVLSNLSEQLSNSIDASKITELVSKSLTQFQAAEIIPRETATTIMNATLIELSQLQDKLLKNTNIFIEDTDIHDRLYNMIEDTEEVIPFDDTTRDTVNNIKSSVKEHKVSRTQIIDIIVKIITIISIVKSFFPDPQSNKTNELLQMQNNQLQQIINLEKQYINFLEEVRSITNEDI